MKSLGAIKRGDYFCFTSQITDATTGLPLTGAAARLKCQLRSTKVGALVADLTIIEQEQGTYLFEAKNTSSWPIELLKTDIQYTDDAGKVSSSETMTLAVEEDITHA